MSWANPGEVFKQHRMLMSSEASFRQGVLALAIGSAAALISLSSPCLAYPLSFVSSGFLLYELLGVIFPPERIRGLRERFFSEDAFHKPNLTDEDGRKGEDGGPHKDSEGKGGPSGSAGPPRAEDMPVFFDDLDIIKRGLSFRKLVFSKYFIYSVKALIAVTFSAVFTFLLSMLPNAIRLFELAAVTAGSSYLACLNFLGFIASQEIDEFSESSKERFMLWFQKTFSHSRGYYFIGEVNGRKIGLPRMLRFMHTLVGGPTGEGKSSGLIIPPLLFDADSPGSAVVPDAKSPELFNWVAGRWLKAGKKVFLFDPWHPDTVGLNFLPEADDQDLLTIVDVVMRERQEAIGKEDRFFLSRTKYLLFAVLKLVQSFEDEYCNLASVYHIVESVKTLDKFIESSPDVIQKNFDDYGDMYSETKVNALTSIREKLDVLMDSAVRKAFSRDEFNLSMLFRENEPCLLVVGAPIDKKEQGTKIASLIVNLVINMAFRARRLQKQAIQRGERGLTPNDLYLYLDELRNLKVTGLADLVSIARETRTHVIGSVTDLGFFRYYREDFGGLLGNFRTRVFLRGLDYDSAKYVADSLGKQNVATYRLVRGLMASQEQRAILPPEKVQNLPENKIIVFSPKTRPFIADRVSVYTTNWLKKMRVPPPKDMRKLYGDMGIAGGPLVDPVLPRVGEHFDMKKIKGAKPPEKLKSKVNLGYFHRETGGGRWRKEQEVRIPVADQSVQDEDEILGNI